MKKVILPLLFIVSFSAIANEYERKNLFCSLFADKESVIESKENLSAQIRINFKAVSIIGTEKIVATTEAELIKFEGHNIYRMQEVPFINNDLKEKLLANIKVKKDNDKKRSIRWYVGDFKPTISSYTSSYYIIDLGSFNKNDVEDLLEELGEQRPDLSKTQVFRKKNAKIKLSDSTDYDMQKTQVHYPINEDYNGLSYHIYLNCSASL